jgi:hypothetical protein
LVLEVVEQLDNMIKATRELAIAAERKREANKQAVGEPIPERLKRTEGGG